MLASIPAPDEHMVGQSLTFPSKNPLNAVVFDIGGVTMRAGYAGEDKPRLILPSAVCPGLDKEKSKKLCLHVDAPSVAGSADSRVRGSRSSRAVQR